MKENGWRVWQLIAGQRKLSWRQQQEVAQQAQLRVDGIIKKVFLYRKP